LQENGIIHSLGSAAIPHLVALYRAQDDFGISHIFTSLSDLFGINSVRKFKTRFDWHYPLMSDLAVLISKEVSIAEIYLYPKPL